MLEVKLRAGRAARWRVLFPALALIGVLASGCSLSSEASRSLQLDASSENAIVVLGTALDKSNVVPDTDWDDRPNSLVTHWQQYDPESMQLIPGDTQALSYRDDTIWTEATLGDPVVHVLEVKSGYYALIGATVFRTTTTFIPLTTSNLIRHTNAMFPLASGIEMQGTVEAEKHFLFEVLPGQVVYVGHFDFVHRGGPSHSVRGNRRSHKIVDVDYWLNEEEARAALKEYPGIKGEMLILNLEEPTETASR